MSLKTIVKVGNISNLSDARYCAGMGVDYLGFCLDPSEPGYMDLDNLKNIQEWVVGPLIVGEFSNNKPDYIRETVLKYSLDMLEVSSPQVLIELSDINIPKILKIDVSNYPDIGKLAEELTASVKQIVFFIIEKSGDSNISFSDLNGIASRYKILIGYDVHKDNVVNWISSANIAGISMQGGPEIKPGFKDYNDLAEILEILEKDD